MAELTPTEVFQARIDAYEPTRVRNISRRQLRYRVHCPGCGGEQFATTKAEANATIRRHRRSERFNPSCFAQEIVVERLEAQP